MTIAAFYIDRWCIVHFLKKETVILVPILNHSFNGFLHLFTIKNFTFSCLSFKQVTFHGAIINWSTFWVFRQKVLQFPHYLIKSVCLYNLRTPCPEILALKYCGMQHDLFWIHGRLCDPSKVEE